jgi:hypothetical protein
MHLSRIAVLATVVTSVTLGSVTNVLAESRPPFGVGLGQVQVDLTAIPRPTAFLTQVAERQTDNLDAARTRVDGRIQSRIAQLNALIKRVQNDSHLPASDQSLLLDEEQAAVNDLTALKAKIDADTTVADIRADQAQIASFHVNDFILPRGRSLVMVDDMLAIANKTNTAISSIQSKLNTLSGKGVNISAVQSALADASAKIQAEITLLSGDESTLVGLTPTSPNLASTFAQIRKDLSTARSDFKAVRADFQQMKSAVAEVSASVHFKTPTPTATATS